MYVTDEYHIITVILLIFLYSLVCNIFFTKKIKKLGEELEKLKQEKEQKEQKDLRIITKEVLAQTGIGEVLKNLFSDVRRLK